MSDYNLGTEDDLRECAATYGLAISADEVDEIIAKIKADALREAAKATRNEAPGEPYAGCTFTAHADGLDELADQIEREA